MKWDTLCLPKCLGGLGFRDFGLFNHALLAKQCWQISRDPTSLLFTVLKGKYFPDSDFFGAGLGSRPSFIWRSLLWGRDLLSDGLRWRIGDGYLAPVYGSNWLPRSPSMKVCSVPTLPLTSKVCDLLTVDGLWDVPKITTHFNVEDCAAIFNIPLGNLQLSDQLV